MSLRHSPGGDFHAEHVTDAPRQKQLNIADARSQTKDPAVRSGPGQPQDSPGVMTAELDHGWFGEVLLGKTRVQLLVVLEIPHQTFSKSRWVALTRKPWRPSRLRISSAIMTERCWPPVQPKAMVR